MLTSSKGTSFARKGRGICRLRGNMRIGSGVLFLAIAPALFANETLDRARQMEDAGNASGARAMLAQAVLASSSDGGLATGYREFLERTHNPGARKAFREAAAEWKKQNKTSNAAAAQRRAVLLDLLANNRAV